MHQTSHNRTWPQKWESHPQMLPPKKGRRWHHEQKPAPTHLRASCAGKKSPTGSKVWVTCTWVEQRGVEQFTSLGISDAWSHQFIPEGKSLTLKENYWKQKPDWAGQKRCEWVKENDYMVGEEGASGKRSRNIPQYNTWNTTCAGRLGL